MQSGSAVTRLKNSPPTMSQGAQAWSQLCAKMAQRARLDAEIVELTGVVQRSGTIEQLEGVPLDTALNLVHRLPAADRAMQLTAADVLADMPVTRQLFGNQTLSWGQVRGIVTEARRMNKAHRALLDAHVAASEDRLAKMDPDDVIDAARAVAQELRDLRAVERSEEAAERGNFFWGQTSMLGRNPIFGELDNLSFAALFAGVDAMAPPDDGRSLAQRRADGLVGLATHRCDAPRDDESDRDRTAEGEAAGAAGQSQPPPAGRRTRHPVLGREAVPSITAIVEVDDASAALGGQVVLPVAGAMPVLSGRIMDALASDAALQIVLMANGRPLAVSRKIWAQKVPRDVAAAIRARDRGDRFPGSRRPIEHLHHIDKRGKGHEIDALVGLAERSHKRVHRNQWRVTVNGREATFTRGDRTWTTLPRGTRFRRPPPTGPPGSTN